MSAVKVTFCVTSYQPVRQVVRLLGAIRQVVSGSTFVVGQDLHPQAVAPHLLAAPGVAVLPLPSRRVRWGSFDFLSMQMAAVRLARARFDPEWIVMLSAEDYPTKNLWKLGEYLAVSPYDALLHEFRGSVKDEHLTRRYSRQGYEVPALLGRILLRREVRRMVNGSRLLHVQDRARSQDPLLEITRRPPLRPGESVHVGSNWWILRRSAADVLSSRWDEDLPLVRHFQRTFIPSESFVHTLLLSGEELKVRSDFELHFIRWQGWSPAHLGLGDLDAMERSGAPFARKLLADSPVLDQLDKCLGIQ